GIARAKDARVVGSTRDRTAIELTMTEGRKREVRRMCSEVGLTVERLVRTSIAGISDRSLPPGGYRALTMDEIRKIYTITEPSR
ncbi:MAG: hypothetical protein KDB69_05140, partial [Acidimicrobiia bacterium]|nr:hypothetical protein [Acidimicrobiia bacterium]